MGTNESHDQDADSGDAAGSNREARYRRELRDAEAERDELKSKIDTLHRAEVDRVVEQHGARPAVLWSTGVELEALLDGDGNVDPAKVTAAADQGASDLGLDQLDTSQEPANQPSAWDAAFGVK